MKAGSIDSTAAKSEAELPLGSAQTVEVDTFAISFARLTHECINIYDY